jgi:hypothetical protein
VLPVLTGLQQAAAGFAAGELIGGWSCVALDHIQRMAAQLREGLKSDSVVLSVDGTFQRVFKIKG